MRSRRAALLVLAFAGLLPASRAHAGDPAAVTTATVPPEAWAVVDGKPLARDEVQKRAKVLCMTDGLALATLVDETIMASRLEKEGLPPSAVTPDEVAKLLEDTRAHLKRLGEDLDARMKQQGVKVEDLAGSFRVACALRKRLEKDATDDALKAFLEKKKLDLAGEVRVRHILVAPKGDELGANRRSWEILSAVSADGANVAGLARVHSDDPMAALDGGDLDWFPAKPFSPSVTGRPVPVEVMKAAFELGKVGLVPQPVRARDGYHVVFVVGTRVLEKVDFEAQKLALKERFLAERGMEIVKAWRAEAKVEYAADAPKAPASMAPFGR